MLSKETLPVEAEKKKQNIFERSQDLLFFFLIVRITTEVWREKILGNKTYNKVYPREVMRTEHGYHLPQNYCDIFIRFQILHENKKHTGWAGGQAAGIGY